MNKLLRILLIVFISIGSANFVLESRGREVVFTVLVIGLLGAAILLTTDIVQKNKHKRIHFKITPIDYSAIVLWIIAIWLVFHESNINHEIHQILDLKRNYLVFNVVHWSIILIVLAAISMLTASLFMFNRARNHSYSLHLAIAIISGSLLALAVTVPIDTFRVGSCGGSPVRLSLLKDGKRIENAKRDAEEAHRINSEFLKNNPGIATGCSIGPAYTVYLF